MIVEALVNLNDIGDEKNYVPGDILVIRPVGWDWGTGDLQSRIVLQIDMPDFPCGADFFVKRQCVKCEHHGITWPSATFTEGLVGTPKVTCIKEQYETESMDFTFKVNHQGIPILDAEMQNRRMGKVLLDTVISAESLATISKETSITEAERDAKLLLSRDEKNLVTMDKLQVKTVVVSK